MKNKFSNSSSVKILNKENNDLFEGGMKKIKENIDFCKVSL